jgi:endonuclease III related protein
MRDRLLRIYDLMFRALGPQRWWPARTRFEVVVGAVLTQNTAWRNVEKAIARLRAAGALRPAPLAALPRPRLARLIQSSGYYNIKARRLQNLLRFLRRRCAFRLPRLFRGDPAVLRQELLAVNGIGRETADSILLYAGNVPIFVVDAYTRRILGRHGLVRPDAPYDEIQALFMAHLPPDAGLFNEYHALVVMVGKDYCRRAPRCEGCPLRPDLPPGGPLALDPAAGPGGPQLTHTQPMRRRRPRAGRRAGSGTNPVERSRLRPPRG